MKFLKFLKREERSSSSYTDALVQAIIANAGGQTVSIPGATAGAEIASGMYQRAFQTAQLDNVPEHAKMALDASLLGLIGRETARRGELVLFIELMNGQIMLTPATSITVTGKDHKSTWRYEITLHGPSGTRTVSNVKPEQVVHLTYATDSERPWVGVGPLQSAETGARLLSNITGALADEAGSPRGSFLPVPRKDGQDTTLVDLRGDIKKANGTILTVESQAQGWQAGDTRGTAGKDWMINRFGANPPAALLELQKLATREMINAYGIPPALVYENPQGTSSREAWRQFLHGTIEPQAKRFASELAIKLDAPGLKFRFDNLFASDIQGRARAFQSMVKAGMDITQAATLSGLQN